jgi:hypothetical protein
MWWQTYLARVDFLALRGHSDSHSAEAVDPHHPASPLALIRLYIEPPGTMPHAVGAGKVGKQSSSIILAHATLTCLLRPPLPKKFCVVKCPNSGVRYYTASGGR